MDGKRLRRWAHQLGFGGHCFTKRRRYSTTFKALREARAEHAAAQHRQASDAPAKSDHNSVPIKLWRYAGRDLSKRPSSSQALRSAVMELAARAGIRAHVRPHVMRHAFGAHVTRHAGIKNAQALLGNADVGTTQIYTGAPTLDEPAAAVEGFRFALQTERAFYPLDGRGANPLEAPTGIEPVGWSSHALEPNVVAWIERQAAAAVSLYRARFEVGA